MQLFAPRQTHIAGAMPPNLTVLWQCSPKFQSADNSTPTHKQSGRGCGATARSVLLQYSESVSHGPTESLKVSNLLAKTPEVPSRLRGQSMERFATLLLSSFAVRRADSRAEVVSLDGGVSVVEGASAERDVIEVARYSDVAVNRC